MVYLTGDTHNEAERFAWIEQTVGVPLTEQDLIIVCGDFGYLNSEQGEQVLDRLEQKTYNICFCDGNHENFEKLDGSPVITWNGGKVHRIRRNVFHLMRGEIFTLQGMTYFVMGGAYSGEGFSVSERELPNNAEYNLAAEHLAAHHNQVDYIVTHTAPREILLRMGKHPYPKEAELNGFLDWVMYEVGYTRWYFGHLHRDESIEPNFRALHFAVCAAGA